MLQSLHRACAEKDYKSVRKLLEEKRIENINSVDLHENTALHVACQVEDLDTVKLLLEHNADVNAKNNQGQTPLYMVLGVNCFYHGSVNLKIIKTLLEHNADPNNVDNNGKTPMAIACESDDLTVVKILLEHDVDMNWTDLQGRTLLHLTTILYASHIFEYLLSQGADINCKCDFGKTVLDYLRDMVFADGFINGQGEEVHRYQIYYCIRIYERAKIQIIKLKCAGLYVSQHNVDLIYSDLEFQDVIKKLENTFSLQSDDIATLEYQCKKEIDMLKRINVCCMTLYHILANDINKTSSLARNKSKCQEIMRILELNLIKVVFPIYIDLIKSRVKEAMRRNELLDVIENYNVSKIFQGLPLICIREIFSYCSTTDIKKFQKAIERMKMI
ncbi:ankyrin repeat and protein kinase domain-containing protein 1-like [Chelonus insularis]|uniref:ankyrin repeat and protein kinase domain-containing protein 1-like n=1 Tax=Chelonus insularis TaxID=460826 RepID=UPI00158A4035|nr:ankyrin repeat and protein kinase domain-containing protein 1-like [Chelonus insularis]